MSSGLRFSILIILSFFAAVSSALAEEADIAVMALSEDMGGYDNDTASPDDSATMKGATTSVGGSMEAVASEVNAGDIEGMDDPKGPDFAKNTSFEEFPKDEQGAGVEGASLADGCSGTVLLASEDLYVDLREEQVINGDLLVCESMKGSGDEMDDYPLVAMIQFNTSGLDVEEDDVAILALKAESMKKGSDDMAATILVPVASDWSENSSFSVLGLSIMSIVDLMPSGEDLAFGQIGIDFGSDQVLAFDVSEHLKAVDGERLSFLLMAVGEVDYRVSFHSRETGEGPAILVLSYPRANAV